MSIDRNNPNDDQLIKQIAQDARASEARMLPETGELTNEQLDYVRERVRQKLNIDDITTEDIDHKIGAAKYSTSRFLQGKYDHSDTNFARRLDRFLIEQEMGLGGLPIGMVRTGLVDRIVSVAKRVNTLQAMGSIVGPSGTSKSTVRKAIEAGIIPQSISVELTETDRTMAQFLRALSKAVGGEKNSSAQRSMNSIKDRLTGTGRLIMIDEAHYLDKRAMNSLRDVHKATGCPVLLFGTQDLLETINDFTAFHGQMKSLFAINYNITVEAQHSGEPLFTIDDVLSYVKAMKLKIDTSGADVVARLASTMGWGGLRAAGFLLLNASVLAKGQLITAKHINTALRQMEGADGFERTKFKMDQHTARRVAIA